MLFRSHTFVEMSQNHYSQDLIERTERDIVHGLNWYLHAPTSTSYVRLLLRLVSLSFDHHPIHQTILGKIERTAYKITELAIVHTYFCHEMALDIALASIYHALRRQQHHKYYTNHFHTVISLNHYWNTILYHLPILQCKQECPTFRRIYTELAKLYCK